MDEDESISPNPDSDDSLSEEICSAAEELSFEERQGSTIVSVDPSASLAALFDSDSQEAKELKPRLFLAWDLLESQPSISGMLIACEWSRDQTLGTTKFTQQYFDQHNIPRMSANNCLFVDVVSSTGSTHGVGALLVLNAYLTVMRSRKYDFLCTIAVSQPGKTLFEKLGFETHAYREGTPKLFCWIRSGDLKASRANRRLRVDSSIPDLCWRHGFSANTSHKRYARC